MNEVGNELFFVEIRLLDYPDRRISSRGPYLAAADAQSAIRHQQLGVAKGYPYEHRLVVFKRTSVGPFIRDDNPIPPCRCVKPTIDEKRLGPEMCSTCYGKVKRDESDHI